MIYTLTVNPALDYVLILPQLLQGEVNRTDVYDFQLGGKGITVSRVLNELKVENLAFGYEGGFVGREILNQLTKLNVRHDFVVLKENSRINVNLKTTTETAINTAGPNVPDFKISELKQKFKRVGPNDYVVMSGSLSKNMPADFYQQMMELLEPTGAKIVIDATKKALLEALPNHPFLIKPNLHELQETFDVEITETAEIIMYAKKLIALGAQNVIVSLGGDGAYLVTKEHVYHSAAAVGKLVNSTGSGDSMIGGFVGTYSKEQNLLDAFAVGMASGAATAFSKTIATSAEIAEILPQIKITTLE